MKQSFTIGIIWTFGTRLWGLATGIVVSVIVTRALGPLGRGQIALLVLISSLSNMLAYMNLSASAVYHINRKKWELRRLFKSLFLLTTLTAIIGCLTAIILFMFWPDENVRELPRLAVALVILTLAIAMYSSNISSILLALREFIKLNFIPLITATIAIPCYWIALWHFNGGVVGWSLISTMISILGLIIICILVLPKIFQQSESLKHENFSILRDCSKLLSYGIISQLGNIAWFLILKADQMIISKFLSVEALGFYAVAVGIAENLRLIPMTVGQILFPFATEKEEDDRRLFISACVRLTFWTLIPLGTILILFGKPIIVILFGTDFLPTVLPYQILIGAVVVLAIGNMLGYEFVSTGRPKLILYCNLICGVFNILMNLLVVPRFGIVGASWVSFTTYALNSAIILHWAIKGSKYRLVDVLKPSKKDILILKDSLIKISKPNS